VNHYTRNQLARNVQGFDFYRLCASAIIRSRHGFGDADVGMNVMSQVGLEEALSRVGMEVRGGNLAEVPWSNVANGASVGNVAWTGRDTGIFVVDWPDSKIVELETLAGKDVIVCTAVLNQDGAWTDFAVGHSRFDAKGVDMTMVFVPQHERFQFVTSASQGLKAVTVVVDLMSMMKARGLPVATLPKSLLRTIRGRLIAMETLAPGHFGAIARDVAARRAMFPSIAALYYEGKTFELVSALLSELSRRDAFRVGDGAFDPRILDRLDLVKQIIDRAPHRILDVDALARVAAMNRTKLRSAFKQVYGTTLSGYRTSLMLQRADRALKQAGANVKQAARHAGYATTSSFIVAYKRRYGVCPGIVLRD
jgi:AraC-like DNA-binding protein